MTKISDLSPILGRDTKTNDLFVMVNLEDGENGTKNITRKELVNAILEEPFPKLNVTGTAGNVNLTNPNINLTSNYETPIAVDDYFFLKDVSTNRTVKIAFADLQNEIARTQLKATKVYVDSSVAASGNGSYYKPLKTLEEAFAFAQAASNPVSISVLPGTHYTNGNLALPDNCSIISTNGQYATNIVMNEGYEEENCFLVGSGCYVQGFTFRNQRVDSFEDPTKGFAIAFRPGALIIRSPYIRDCGQVSNYTQQSIAAPLDPVNANPLVGRGGGVLLADRSVLNQNSIFTYMLAFGATPRSPNGLGYVAKNGAGINGISSISIFQRTAFYALNGGQITLNNSGTQFGDISMRAKGFTPVVDPYETTIELVDNPILGEEIYSDANTIIDAMWNDLELNGYDFVDEAKTRRDAGYLLRSVTYDVIAGQQTGSRNFIAGLFDYKADRLFVPTTQYNYEKCHRDALLITEAVAYDMAFGSNFRSIKAALAYYRASASEVTGAQKQITLDTITELKNVFLSKLSDANSITRATNNFNIILDIFENGEGVVPSFVLPDPTGFSTGFSNARRLLVANKTFIQDEIDAWIASEYPSLVYDEAACRRDVGFIVDALRYDLTYGGNLETYNAATAYFVGSTAQYGEGEKAATLAAYGYLRSILENILTGVNITPSSGNVTPQDTSGTPGTEEAAIFAQSRISDIIFTITNDGTAPTRTLPSTVWVSSGYLTSFETIQNDPVVIANGALEFINKQEKTLLGAFLTSFDFMRDYIVNNYTLTSGEEDMIISLFDDVIKKTLLGPKRLNFGSLIESLGHQFNLAGAGVNKNALPLNFRRVGKPLPASGSVLQEDGGRVRWSGADELNNTYFTKGLRVNGRTGRLEGRPFTSSVRRLARRAANSRTFT